MSEEKEYPKHIGFILDGNRRWAKERGKMPWAGHAEGAKNVERLKNWMIDLNVKVMTLYAFSLQNFERTKKEVNLLLNIFEKELKKLLTDKDVYKYKFKIKFIGRINLFTQKLQNLIREIEKKTEKHNNYFINFAVAYGGQEEIVDAVKKICRDKSQKIDKLTPEIFKKYLYLDSYPDIIIRTSGEQRTSNFLVWQQAYAEWFFPKKFWPDFTKNDLKKIIKQYLKRERRFGK